MGSLLYQRGVYLTRCYDELNVSQPDRVKKVHQDYILAGADVIETNTFGANAIALNKHGYKDRAQEITIAGAALAKTAAKENTGRPVFVAGAIGPTGEKYAEASLSTRQQLDAALAQQAVWLVDSGVDLLILETFSSLSELTAAVAACKPLGIPIVAQMVFDQKGLAEGSMTGTLVAQKLKAAGADVVGANCGVGPQELYQVAETMLAVGCPIAIAPNAGLPAEIDGRTIYVANPEYFSVYARRLLKLGVSAIGGCCGTTPEHIRSMRGAIAMYRPSPRAQTIEPPLPLTNTQASCAVPLAKRSTLGHAIATKTFVASIELTSPTGTNPGKLIDKFSEMKSYELPICNIADGPRASARMGNIAACSLAIDHGIEPILHVCCRDRSFLGLLSHLLAAHTLGIRNLVIITGDPPKMGNYRHSTGVYDVDSVGLIEVVAGLNRGVDPSGKQLDSQTEFVIATGAEPAATDYQREIDRLHAKVAAGAELIMTQPVYDPKTLQRFLDDTKSLGVPTMVGLLPMASYRNAEFLHNNVPGMQIPQEYRNRMRDAEQGESARLVGIDIAKNALAAVRHRVDGAYIMPPFNRVASAAAVLEKE